MSNPPASSSDAESPKDHYSIRIRNAWYAECANAGLRSDAAIAQALNVSRQTVYNAQGGGPCGGRLVASALAVLGPAKFNLLFKITAS